MDAKEQLLDTWRINARIDHYLLEALTDEQLSTKLAKGKAVDGQFAHIHNVRLMWLKAAAPDLWGNQRKLELPCNKSDLAEQLMQSDAAISELISRSWDNGGKVKNFKPHVTAFVGYLIAHESFHRGHAEVALRQAGIPLPDSIAYGIWEWGPRG